MKHGPLDYGEAGSFGFRPNFGRSAGMVVSGKMAGKQFRQWTSSVLVAPLLYLPVSMVRQEVPKRSKMRNGPSEEGLRDVVFDLGRLTYT